MKINVKTEYERVQDMINVLQSVRMGNGIITRKGIIRELKEHKYGYDHPENFADEMLEFIKRRKFVTNI